MLSIVVNVSLLIQSIETSTARTPKYLFESYEFEIPVVLYCMTEPGQQALT